MADSPSFDQMIEASDNNRQAVSDLPLQSPPPPTATATNFPTTTGATTTSPSKKCVTKAVSNSFSFSSTSTSAASTTSSSSSSNGPHATIHIHGQSRGSPLPPPPGHTPKDTQIALHAHALPIKDIVYKVPTPLPEDHPSKIAEKRRQRRCNPCMRRCTYLASLLLTAILLVAIAILLFYLIAQPKLPKLDIQSLTVTSLNITDSSATKVNSAAANYAGYVSAAMVMRLKLSNVNKKMGVGYEDLKGQVWYEGTMLSQASMEGSSVYQNARNMTEVQVEMYAEQLGLDQKDAGSLKKSLTANATVAFQVSTSGNVALQLGGWKLRDVSLNVTCTVQVSTHAMSALIPESCVASPTRLPFLLLLPSK